MTRQVRIAFDDTPLSEAEPLEVLVVDLETRRQRYWLERALVALGQGETKAVEKAVNKMETL